MHAITHPLPARQLKGDLAVWILILSELLVFGLFFLGYAVAARRHPALFEAGQATLDTGAATLNTLALLAASAVVVMAIERLERQRTREAGRLLALAALLGSLFLVNKALELHHHLALGITLSTSLFHMFYLGLVSFHFMHVLAGVIVLSWVARRCLRDTPPELNTVWSAGAYWHMVDLVWVVLFPLVYLL